MIIEGASSDLFFTWKISEKYHIVSALIKILSLPRFSHISIDDACDAISKWLGNSNGSPFRCRAEPVALSETQVCNVWGRSFGMSCSRCRKVVRDNDHWIQGYAWWWQDYEACQNCALKIIAQQRKFVRKLSVELPAMAEDRRLKIARLESEVADLQDLFKDLKGKANDRFKRHGRRQRKDVGALEETRSRKNHSH